jgi:hypothetical protein
MSLPLTRQRPVATQPHQRSVFQSWFAGRTRQFIELGSLYQILSNATQGPVSPNVRVSGWAFSAA